MWTNETDMKALAEEILRELGDAPSGYDYDLPEGWLDGKDPMQLSVDEVKELIRHLEDNDASFHWDDWSEVPHFSSNNGETRLFSPRTAAWIMQAIVRSGQLDWGEHECHHGYMISYRQHLDGQFTPDAGEVLVLPHLNPAYPQATYTVVHSCGPKREVAVLLGCGHNSRFYVTYEDLDHPKQIKLGVFGDVELALRCAEKVVETGAVREMTTGS